ncbi:hypothetical protein AAMO2058_000008700 [Amorphochlora amoebiformis]
MEENSELGIPTAPQELALHHETTIETVKKEITQESVNEINACLMRMNARNYSQNQQILMTQ